MADHDEQPAAPAAADSTTLLLAELAFVLLGVAGIAAIHVPAAAIVGAVLGVIACERASARRQARAAAAAPAGEEQR